MTTVDRPDMEPVPRHRHAGRIALLLVSVLAGALMLLIYWGKLPPVLGFVALAVVLTTLFWLIRAHLPSILLVFMSVLLVSIVATQRMPKLRPDRMEAAEGEQLSRKWAASGGFNEKLPVVVHLIFDELVSVGAMTNDLPNGARVRRLWLDFAEKHSLRMFDSVYSRSYYTSESIPHMMNSEYLGRMGTDAFTYIPFNEQAKTFTIDANAYFDDMARRGYRTAVFQNTYMNFCANPNVDLCEAFDSFDPASKDAKGLDSPTQRLSLWRTVLRAYGPSYTSALGERLVDRAYGFNTSDVAVVGGGGRYDVHRFPEWFDRFTRFVAGVPRGSHVFAHFLVPHSPYLLMENCVLSGKVDLGYGLGRFPANEREAKRRDFYRRYLTQTACVQRKLDAFMSAISESDDHRDAVIIIHGDHGSRIAVGDMLEDYGPRDYVDNYATFFAVRAPGVKPGLDCEFASLPEVFRRYVALRIDPAPRSGPPLPVVVLSRAAGNAKVEAQMPMFGCAAGNNALASP